jgi:hypothetical protein
MRSVRHAARGTTSRATSRPAERCPARRQLGHARHYRYAARDPGLLPEDIDYDTRRQRFLVTSVLQHKIVSVDSSGKVTARGIGILDIRTKQVAWIQSRGKFALVGIDGLYRMGNVRDRH